MCILTLDNLHPCIYLNNMFAHYCVSFLSVKQNYTNRDTNLKPLATISVPQTCREYAARLSKC